MFQRTGKILIGLTLAENATCKTKHETRSAFNIWEVVIAAAIIMLLFAGMDAFAQQENEKEKLTVGVRYDAPPFCYYKDFPKKCDGECSLDDYKGFSVEICKKIVEQLGDSKSFSDKINVKEVTAQDRLRSLAAGKIDLLCGATTVTLGRMQVVDFSLFTFVSGVSVMYKDAPVFKKKDEDAAIKLGYLNSTTSEKVDERIKKKVQSELGYGDNVEIDCKHPQDSHYDGLKALIDGNIDVYLADREILLALQKRYSENPKLFESQKQHSKNPELVVSREYFTIEPYAIGLNRDNPELKVIVNTVLSKLFGDALSLKTDMPILDLLRAHFPGSSFSKSLINLYRSQRLREGDLGNSGESPSCGTGQ